MIPKFRAWRTPFKGKKFGQEMKYGRAGTLLSFAEMSPDDYILMQSTGLKDKNGVEIFEGDIVRITSFPGDWYSTIGHIVWGLDEPMSGAYPAFFIPEFESEMNSFSQIFDSGEYEIEAIGNIYENPELLEVE